MVVFDELGQKGHGTHCITEGFIKMYTGRFSLSFIFFLILQYRNLIVFCKVFIIIDIHHTVILPVPSRHFPLRICSSCYRYQHWFHNCRYCFDNIICLIITLISIYSLIIKHNWFQCNFFHIACFALFFKISFHNRTFGSLFILLLWRCS